MSHPYNTWASGTKFSPEYCQEWADALGAINGDAFHTEQPSSYLVFKSGSNYYVRNGSDGTIEASATGTSSSGAINWAITQLANRGGIVTTKGPITVDATILMNQHGVTLQGDSLWCGYATCASGGGYAYNGLYLDDNVDDDMIYVTGKSCAIQHLFLDGNKANQTAGSNIKIEYSGGNNADCHLNDIYSFYAKEYAFEVLGAVFGVMCFGEYGDADGWYIGGNYGRYVGCTGTSNGGNGWLVASTSEQNRLIGCTGGTNDEAGFKIQGYNTVLKGCQAYNNDKYGIHLNGGYENVIDGCQLERNGQALTNTYSHIYLNSNGGVHSTYNVITDNELTEYGATVAKYGIEEADANQDYNVVSDNRIESPGTNYVSLAGLNDELKTVGVPFVDGTAYDDMGWDVDQAAEYATAWFTLPSDVTQVIRLYIYAYSVATETHAMELAITVNGGASNEAYNTHSYSGAGVDSTETNFTAGDLIYWRVTDSGVLALQRFDCVQVKVVYAAAAGDNCATDARFRNVYVEYV